MDDADYKGEEVLPAVAECTDSRFEEDDPAKLATLATSDRATEAWYSGKQYYDFKAGTFKSALGTKS